MNTYNKTRNMVMTSAIAAIIVIMAFVPFLGYIPLGFMNATIIHIPVIIGAILLGPRGGAFLGLVFGLTSLWKNTFMPNPTSFVFSPFVTIGGNGGNGFSLIICLVPRILIGIVAYYVYQLVWNTYHSSEVKRQSVALICAGVAGSLTNTLLVMNFIYIFFGGSYASASNNVLEGFYKVIVGIICMQGIPEAIVAGILTLSITRIMIKIK